MADKWVEDEQLKILLAELKRFVREIEERLEMLEMVLKNERGHR